ncbi:MAG: DDB1- and CUL4-associated factor 12, partial [Marteilia pararefringens]
LLHLFVSEGRKDDGYRVESDNKCEASDKWQLRKINLPNSSEKDQTSVGIRSIEFNADLEIVALTNGKNRIVLLRSRLSAPKAYETRNWSMQFDLIGEISDTDHSDVIFQIKWINNTTLIAVSKDSIISKWEITRDFLRDMDTSKSRERSRLYEEKENFNSVHFFREESGQSRTIYSTEVLTNTVACHSNNKQRYRSIAYDEGENQFLSTSLNSSIELWDAERMETIGSRNLWNYSELVCCHYSCNSGLYFIGSCGYLLIGDFRERCKPSKIKMAQKDCGIRSIEEFNGQISLSTTENNLMFLDHSNMCAIDEYGKQDKRKRNIVSSVSLKETIDCTAPEYVSDDHINIYIQNDLIGEDEIRKNAIYSHKYRPYLDASEGCMQILAAGGPLIVGIKGVYLSLWS